MVAAETNPDTSTSTSISDLYASFSETTLSHLALLPCAGPTETGEYEYNPHVFVRYFPAPHQVAPGEKPELPTNEAQNLITVATFHFNVLNSCGINAPTTPMGLESPHSATTRIVRICDRVDGPDVQAAQHINHDTFCDPNPEATLQIASALTKYYDWVLTTNQPMFLSDIAAHRQHKITNEGVTLVDADPFMHRLVEIHPDLFIPHVFDARGRLRFSLRLIENMVDDLPDCPKKSQQARAIENLIELFYRKQKEHYAQFREFETVQNTNKILGSGCLRLSTGTKEENVVWDIDHRKPQLVAV